MRYHFVVHLFLNASYIGMYVRIYTNCNSIVHQQHNNVHIQNVVCTFQHSDNRLSDINFGVNKMLNPISFSVKLSYPQQEDIFIHTQNLLGNFFRFV